MLVEVKIGANTLEATLENNLALTCKMEFTSSRYLLCTLEELFALLHKETCTRKFTAVQIIIAKTW